MVVTDQYEPGSTFKMVVTAAALEAGLVTPETTFTLGRRSRCTTGWSTRRTTRRPRQCGS